TDGSVPGPQHHGAGEPGVVEHSAHRVARGFVDALLIAPAEQTRSRKSRCLRRVNELERKLSAHADIATGLVLHGYPSCSASRFPVLPAAPPAGAPSGRCRSAGTLHARSHGTAGARGWGATGTRGETGWRRTKG